ncbi:MAG: methionine gamma-lyase family protein, partial [Lachnospiraceae bacterium]|nr:methionine gamma-lyase family protein [Lachnospiraceae bacterium]
MINKDILRDYYKGYGIDEDVFDFGEKILDELKERFDNIDRVSEINHLRVMDAFRKNRVDTECFNLATGYGYDDIGRDKLEQVYADLFHGEDALVRPQITCGTHALALA